MSQRRIALGGVLTCLVALGACGGSSEPVAETATVAEVVTEDEATTTSPAEEPTTTAAPTTTTAARAVAVTGDVTEKGATTTTKRPSDTSASPPPTEAPSTETPSTETPSTTGANAVDAPTADPCAAVAALQQSFGSDAHFVDGLCIDGWAYVETCVGECGDSDVVARYRAGRWEAAIAFPTPVCRNDALAMGVPPAIVDRVYWPCSGGEPTVDYRDEPTSGRLLLGHRGPRVEGLQSALASRGYLSRSDVDGYFGPGTERAVVAYQRAAGLQADGIAGQDTLGSLGLYY